MGKKAKKQKSPAKKQREVAEMRRLRPSPAMVAAHLGSNSRAPDPNLLSR